MPGGFCKWTTEGDRTECHRCGSICYDGGEPTCPPWVTRDEPDNSRLPHIKTHSQNHAAYQDWYDRQEYKKKRPQREPHL
jgi:transcription initiation factor TFIIIB Brf1 subunit/transcription initiation factor TFIIB